MLGEQDHPAMHFHMGPFQHILERECCPGCRLIISLLNHAETGDSLAEQPIQLRTRLCASDAISGPFDVGDPSWMDASIEVGIQRWGSLALAGAIIRKCDDPCTHHDKFRGVFVPEEASIERIQQWIQSCSKWHNQCHAPTEQRPISQWIRLVDVQQGKIVKASLTERYVALSYVWGSAAPLLTQDTLTRYSCPSGLDHASIPRTIADSMQLVRDLGERYLWVDSLCIIQDCDDDKQKQLPIMDSIFKLAEFVIVAASGSDAFAGLPGLYGTKRSSWQTSETIDGVELITIQQDAQQALHNSIWNTRGWTFQEFVLARRSLVFTDSQIYWCCRAGTRREDLCGDSSKLKLAANNITSLQDETRRHKTCRTGFYCRLVQKFNPRHFKDDSDTLWAFLGLLKLQAPQFPQGYIWGHPYERLDATLLWNQTCRGMHSRDAKYRIHQDDVRYDLPYPSWSWLSTNSEISFVDPCGASIISEVEWHESVKLGQEMPAAYQKSLSPSRAGKAIDLLSSTSDISDYGLLHFTAQTAKLILSYEEADGEESGEELPENVLAQLQTSTGETMTTILVPSRLFSISSKVSCESILLSSNAEDESDEVCTSLEGPDCGCVAHVRGCHHVTSQNVMLIEWEENVAFRVALAKIDKEHWSKVDTRTITILLG
ncbi:hypothetical protein FDECE_3480 [Fusarium decemcellulare]|nr:hypothetical protein FDECE_3480 [Fusarium decemcellulare]